MTTPADGGLPATGRDVPAWLNRPMRLAVSLDYARPPLPQIATAVALEEAGIDEVLVPEAYGYDTAVVLGALAVRTRRVALGPGVVPVFTRTPALIAQTAAALDSVSGGRAVLGIGTSGPGVVEGFHGVPFAAPLARLREVVATCRAMWRREPPPGGSLRPILGPERAAIPILMATMRPGGLALAAELADSWYPLMFAPGAVEGVWARALAEGRARRDPALGPLAIHASFHVGVDRDGERAREEARRHLALYVGGMGPPGRNFYNEVVARMGWAGEAAAIQRHFMAGRRDDAARAVSGAMLDAFTVTGSPGCVRERLAALSEAGVTTLVVRGPAAADPGRMAALRELVPGG